MNWADWIIVAVIGISGLISLKRGFVKEALSLVVWIAAFVVAIAFHDRLATLLTEQVSAPSLRAMLAFAILFIATLIIGALVNALLSALVQATGLSGTDRVLGMVFGFARGALVILALVVVIPMLLPVQQDAWWQQSRIIPHFALMDEWARTTFADLVGVASAWRGESQ